MSKVNNGTNFSKRKPEIFSTKQLHRARTLQTLVFCLLVWGISSFAGQISTEKSNYKIIISDNPSKICQLASSELESMLEKTYGSGSIKFNDSDDPMVFYIGVSGEAIMAGFTELPDMHGKFGVFRKDRNILLYGWDDEGIDPEKNMYGEAGTLLAVYYFLNKYIGTEFYFPGENGYSIAKNHAIIMRDNQDIPIPSFVLRGFHFRTKEYSSIEKLIFSRRLLGSIPLWAEIDINYVYLKNWKNRFMSSHPEYFMLRGGKRISEIYPNHVPCFSNPDVIKQTAADIVEDINKNQSKTTVKIFCDAPINLCQCAKCVAMAEYKYCKDDSSEAVYGFQKKIADIVHQTHPGIYFLTQTKGASYYKVPELIKLGDRFTVNILTARHLTNVQAQSFALEVAKKWHEAGVRTTIFGYPRYNDVPTKNMPVITPHFTAEYFRAYNGITSGTVTNELNFNPYSFSALNQYIQAKLLFAVNVDVDKLILEFCAFAYPGAEEEMVQFYNEMERLYRQRQDVHFDPFNDIYYATNLEKPMQLLVNAGKKIKGNTDFYHKLYTDFKSFYERSQDAKLAADRWNEKIQKRKLELPETVILSCAEKSPSSNTPFEEWKNTVKLNFSSPTEYINFQGGSAYMCCDKQYLYIGLVANEEQTAQLMRKSQKNNTGSPWQDDSFELMLMPSAQDIYYQIVVNSNGVHTVLLKRQKRSEIVSGFKIETSAKVSDNQWTAFVKIPLSQFGEDAFEKPWKFNFFRNRRCGDKPQSSGIRLLGSNFHITDDYITLLWPKGINHISEL